MSMGIVNPGSREFKADLKPDCATRVEDVVLNRRDDATEELLEVAAKSRATQAPKDRSLEWRQWP